MRQATVSKVIDLCLNPRSHGACAGRDEDFRARVRDKPCAETRILKGPAIKDAAA